MKAFRESKKMKFIAAFLAVNIVSELVFPAVAMALTSGPSSPDFAGFEPVATTDIVDPFTGNMTYNIPVLSIPGPDGAGYAMSLSYHSGKNQEDEQSWVGGWDLNPGVINRNTRGFADDMKGNAVRRYNKVKPSWTVTRAASYELELMSNTTYKGDKGGGNYKNLLGGAKFLGKMNKLGLESVGLSFNTSLRYNNYQGYMRSNGMNLTGSFKSFNAGVSINRSAGQYSVGFNSSCTYFSKKIKSLFDKSEKVVPNPADKHAQVALAKSKTLKAITKRILAIVGGSLGAESVYGLLSFGSTNFTTNTDRYFSKGHNYKGHLQINPSIINLGFGIGNQGSYSIKANLPKQDFKVHGYMYNPSIQAIIDSETEESNDGSEYSPILSDYTVEKEEGYTRRQNFIGMPFNNADQFVVSGEGIGGGFRMYHSKVGHFYPNRVENLGTITSIGAEFAAGVDIAAGLDVGFGWTNMKVREWKNMGDAEGYQYDENDNNRFFRFTNDMGGSVKYSTNDEYLSFKPSNGIFVPGARVCHLENDPGYATVDAINNGRSSFVDYRLMSELAVDALDKSADIKKYRDDFSSNPINDSRIAEYATINESGMKHIFGLPVFAQKEKNIQFSNRNYNFTSQDKVNLLKYESGVNHTDYLKNNFVVGEENNDPYATTYLLTQIVGSNYIDLSSNGPSSDDIGAWTKFRYRKQYGAGTVSGQWYRHRSPYNGYYVHKGTMSDLEDDMLSFNSGEKEVYNLKYVETKTHIAFFVTNEMDKETARVEFKDVLDALGLSDTDREVVLNRISLPGKVQRDDAIGAADNTTAGTSPTAQGTQRLEYLDRIVLFNKSKMEKPMQVTRFQYDYSLCHNTPNSVAGNDKMTTGGKLTLKKLWMEYEGVEQIKSAPYQFEYQYKRAKDFTSDEIKTKYPEIVNYAETLAAEKENPSYEHGLDPWGNFQPGGEKRLQELKAWSDQSKTPMVDYDPANWYLKQIKLPSGGEILFQYEAKDYRFVQDKEAMAMINLIKVDPTLEDGERDTYGKDDDDEEWPRYYIDHKALGIPDAKIAEYVQVLKNHFKPKVDYPNKTTTDYIYYKVLYSFNNTMHDNVQEPMDDLSMCGTEYATGFAEVNSVEYVEGKGIYIELCDNEKGFYLPRSKAYQTYVYNFGGKDEYGCNGLMEVIDREYKGLMASTESTQDVYDDVVKSGKHSSTLLDFVFERGGSISYGTPNPDKVCQSISHPNSYLRVPLLTAKKGDGARVKRVLMYDKGLEANDEVLYGTEYSYVTEDGQSSGVTSNEPSAAHDENPLFNIAYRHRDGWFHRVFAGGKNVDQEGPLGESVYPGASVGHSRVVMQNIHTGKTGTGYVVNEYNTYKDYPIANGTRKTDLSKGDAWDWMNLPLAVINYSIKKAWQAQGMVFTLHALNGTIKKTSTHTGKYGEVGSRETSYQKYTYATPGNEVKMMYYDKPTGKYRYELGYPGREEDITMEMKEVQDQSMDIKLEIDIDFGIAVKPGFSLMPSFSYDENQIATHATTRVVSYPVIMLSTESYLEGVKTTTNNLAFDKYTGKPVVVQAFDAYDNYYNYANGQQGSNKGYGSVISVNIPASWMYDTFQQIATELGTSSYNANPIRTNQLGLPAGSITFTSVKAEDLFNGGIVLLDNHKANVINASAVIYDNNWFNTSDSKIQAILNEYGIGESNSTNTAAIAKLNNQYLPYGSFVFNGSTKSAHLADNNSNRIYNNAGAYENFELFDWKTNTSATVAAVKQDNEANQWKMLSQNMLYSPNLQGLEDKSIINPSDPNSDIYSCVKFGYTHMLPVMTAQNARYTDVTFQYFEEGTLGDNRYAHTGLKSLCYNNHVGYKISDASKDHMKLNPQLLTDGGVVRLWMKRTLASGAENKTPNFHINVNGKKNVPLNKVAQTGEWSLYEAHIVDWSGIAANTELDISIGYDLVANEEVFIDDIKFTPRHSGAMCYVYDPLTYRLLAEFNDQHFAVFYQYNLEGQLVRKSIETERGTKTLMEKQYNIKRQPK